MKTTLWLTTFSMFLSAPLGFSKTELETLRSTVAEQERQIRQLEEDNMKLRSLNGQPVKAPAAQAAAANKPSSATAPAASGSNTYTVKSGDTLAKIARKNGTTAQALARQNGIKDPTRLSIGQKIKLPGSTAAAAAAAPAPAAAPSPVPGSDTYIVRDGETFYSIARKHSVSPESLVDANPGIKPSELRTGQLIRLNAKSASSTVSKPATANKPAVETASVAHNSPAQTPVPAPAALAPAAPSSPAAAASPAPAPAASAPKTAVHSVTIDGEMTYGEFAAKHGTQVERLNELNGLDLPQNTVLAKGSELYVSAQP